MEFFLFVRYLFAFFHGKKLFEKFWKTGEYRAMHFNAFQMFVLKSSFVFQSLLNCRT